MDNWPVFENLAPCHIITHTLCFQQGEHAPLVCIHPDFYRVRLLGIVRDEQPFGSRRPSTVPSATPRLACIAESACLVKVDTSQRKPRLFPYARFTEKDRARSCS